MFAGLSTEPGKHDSRFIFSPNLIKLGVQILDTRDKRFSMHTSFNTREAGFIKHVNNLHVYCRLKGTHAQCVLHKKVTDPAYGLVLFFCLVHHRQSFAHSSKENLVMINYISVYVYLEG